MRQAEYGYTGPAIAGAKRVNVVGWSRGYGIPYAQCDDGTEVHGSQVFVMAPRTSAEIAVILQSMATVVERFQLASDEIDGCFIERAELQVGHDSFLRIAASAMQTPIVEKFEDQRHFHMIVAGIKVSSVHELELGEGHE